MLKPESRCLCTSELRFETIDDRPIIRGYAILYNSLSRDMDGFREIIRPGALRTALANPNLDVLATINHSNQLLLGRSTSKTLRMTEGDKGLYVEIDVPNTTFARDLTESMKRGDISGMSFVFTMFDDPNRGQIWSNSPEGFILREITEFGSLRDVSVVTYPAYPETQAAVRSLELFRQSNQPVPYKRLLASKELYLLTL